MVETPPETVTEPSEARGGEDPDWDAVHPGEPLRRRPAPEIQGGDHEG